MRLFTLDIPMTLVLRSVALSALVGTMVCGMTVSAPAQDPRPQRYFPLNTPLPPPGRAGDWAGRLGKASPVRFQLVQIQLPGDGQVTWFEGGPQRSIPQVAPASVGLLVGPVYRFKLSHLSDLPGVELYPTIELLDRLHPPLGREAEFPLVVEFTEREIAYAQEGRLVTKVIYLEQPNRAAPLSVNKGKPLQPIEVGPRENAMTVADENGRPMAIIRLGGRQPDVTRPEPGFYGAGAPLNFSVQAKTPDAAAEAPPSEVESESSPEAADPAEATTE